MNHARHYSKAGFTLVELAVSGTILAVVVSVSMASLVHVLRSSAIDREQNELDIQLQVAMEWLKYDLRLSSLDEIYYHPAGPGPYSAISFPLARDDNGDGAVDTDENGAIIWAQTVVYHVWTSSPSQLRKTVFDPRVLDLTPSERQVQIDAVVSGGDAATAVNSNNANTTVVFENLFEWRITPRSSTYDGYDPELSRDINRYLGSCILGGGLHEFKFEVIGTNAASSGRKIGLDSMVVSASYGTREGEAQLPVYSEIGATAVATQMEGGSWSGNFQLLFPATADGHSFTLRMANDQWEETNFRHYGHDIEDLVIDFDTTIANTNFLLRLDGDGECWHASEQTGATNEMGYIDDFGEYDPDDSIRGCAVRVVLKGEELSAGTGIQFGGAHSWLRFAAGGTTGTETLGIEEVYIAEATETVQMTPDIDPTTLRQLVSLESSSTAFTLTGTNSTRVGGLSAFYPIDRDKSYVVMFRTRDTGNAGHARYWPERMDSEGRGCYFVTNASSADTTGSVWSARADLHVTNRLYAVQYMYASYPSTGLYTTAAFDTHRDTPTYSSLDFSSDVPPNSYLGIKIRTASSNDLSDATAWTNVTALTSPGTITPGNGRYVQFQVELRPDPTLLTTPRLHDVTIKWQGEERLVDVGGTLTKGPDYGIFELTVDGESLITGLNIDLEIFKDVPGYAGERRLTSWLTSELVPRNSGW